MTNWKTRRLQSRFKSNKPFIVIINKLLRRHNIYIFFLINYCLMQIYLGLTYLHDKDSYLIIKLLTFIIRSQVFNISDKNLNVIFDIEYNLLRINERRMFWCYMLKILVRLVLLLSLRSDSISIKLTTSLHPKSVVISPPLSLT